MTAKSVIETTEASYLSSFLKELVRMKCFSSKLIGGKLPRGIRLSSI